MNSCGNESEQKVRGVTFNDVGRNRLLQALNNAFHVGDLTIANFSERDILQQELESLAAETSASVKMKIHDGTKFGHTVIPISAALALSLSYNRSKGVHIGTSK